jgi:hypothetical protein
VRDQADRPRSDGADEYVGLAGCGYDGGGIGYVDHHDVRVHGGGIHVARLGEQPGVLVVLGEPVDVVVEGVEPGGGQDADLPHPAAHPLAPDPRFRDRLVRADHQRPDRGAEALAQADRHHGAHPAVLLERDAGRDVCVPDPGAVDVQADVLLVDELAKLADRLGRDDRSAAEVVGVLDRDRRGRHEERAQVRCEHRLDG